MSIGSSEFFDQIADGMAFGFRAGVRLLGTAALL
jgi:hypothetical protein